MTYSSPLTYRQRSDLMRLAERIRRGEWDHETLCRLSDAIPILVTDIDALLALQSCGHPVQCLTGGEDEPDEGGTRFCAMCRLEAEVRNLRKHRDVTRGLVRLCRELDAELDGVRLPATAAAITCGIRTLLNRLEDE